MLTSLVQVASLIQLQGETGRQFGPPYNWAEGIAYDSMNDRFIAFTTVPNSPSTLFGFDQAGAPVHIYNGSTLPTRGSGFGIEVDQSNPCFLYACWVDNTWSQGTPAGLLVYNLCNESLDRYIDLSSFVPTGDAFAGYWVNDVTKVGDVVYMTESPLQRILSHSLSSGTSQPVVDLTKLGTCFPNGIEHTADGNVIIACFHPYVPTVLPEDNFFLLLDPTTASLKKITLDDYRLTPNPDGIFFDSTRTILFVVNVPLTVLGHDMVVENKSIAGSLTALVSPDNWASAKAILQVEVGCDRSLGLIEVTGAIDNKGDAYVQCFTMTGFPDNSSMPTVRKIAGLLRKVNDELGFPSGCEDDTDCPLHYECLLPDSMERKQLFGAPYPAVTKMCAAKS